ncbi:hypothetical protein RJ46_18125 [Vibrio sinaloensis]|nr:hypothetical protein RJ46_18125 [Vibrio sinaloensis]
MQEIKMRSEIISKIAFENSNGALLTGYIDTDLDMAYLQGRKICELIMYACVAANQASSKKLNSILKKSYKPLEIKRHLLDINSHFFPKATNRIGDPKNGPTEVIPSSELHLALNIDELVSFWGKSGDFLHAKRSANVSQDKKLEFLSVAVDFLMKVVKLLNHHWIVVDETTQFAVLMQPVDRETGKVLGKVQVAILKKVA